MFVFSVNVSKTYGKPSLMRWKATMIDLLTELHGSRSPSLTSIPEGWYVTKFTKKKYIFIENVRVYKH